jgi:hypothetical protein
MASRQYKIPERAQDAAVFDPDCVILGARVIDWCSFGFGNTVLVDPMVLGMKSSSLEKAARAVAAEHGWLCDVSFVPNESIRDGSREREQHERRLAVVFRRKQMVNLLGGSQAEFIGAVQR